MSGKAVLMSYIPVNGPLERQCQCTHRVAGTISGPQSIRFLHLATSQDSAVRYYR
jgi:hypothetical protein